MSDYSDSDSESGSDYDYSVEEMIEVATEGDLERLMRMTDNGNVKLDDYSMRQLIDAAAESGSIQCIKFVYDSYGYWSRGTAMIAMINGGRKCLEYVMENGCIPGDEIYLDAIRCHGDHESLQYLFERGVLKEEQMPYLYEKAVLWHEPIKLLTVLFEGGCPFDERAYLNAASIGNIKAIKFLHERGCPWNSDVFKEAAYYGHFEVIKYAHENGCPQRPDLCMLATKSVVPSNDRLKIIQFAHENGYAWDAETTHYAAAYGYLDVLKYALKHGCPMDGPKALKSAILNKKDTVVEYLKA